LNKIRRLAEDLVTRYPTIFSSDFENNKKALSQVSVIRARSIRNQLAGAITRIIHEQGSSSTEHGEEPTLGEKIIAEVEQESQAPKDQTQVPATPQATVSQDQSS
jgi:small subunit ribosomal protein S17e